MDDQKENKPSRIPSCCKENENLNKNENQTDSQDKANKDTDESNEQNDQRGDRKENENQTGLQDKANKDTHESNEQNDQKGDRKDGEQNSCCNPRSSCCDFTENFDLDQLILEHLFDDSFGKTCTPIGAQSLTTFVALLILFTSGVTVGYSAILLPQLRQPGSVIKCDDETAPWIASIATIPMAPGSFIVGYVMEKYGRRSAHVIVCVPIFVGWLFIVCAQGLIPMLLGRFVTGVCIGFLGPLTAVFVGECTAPKYRGFTLAGGAFAIAVGIFTVHLIGTFVHWRVTAVIFCLVPFIGVTLLSMVPESPIWLISKGKITEGVKAFFWLRGRGEMARKELKDILRAQIERNRRPKLTLAEKLKSLKRPEFIKPLLTMIIFHVTAQFSGIFAIIFYSIDIVTECVGMAVDQYVIMMCIDTVRVVMGAIACVLCKICGRRPLCFISGSLSALSMLSLSLYLYCTQEVTTSKPVWIPIACLLGYICSSSIALVPMPWMMGGEVFPTQSKGLGSGLCTASAYAAFYIVVQTEPEMMNRLGNVVTFFIYGCLASIGTCILFFILPETTGKSLQEIENEFLRARNINQSNNQNYLYSETWYNI